LRLLAASCCCCCRQPAKHGRRHRLLLHIRTAALGAVRGVAVVAVVVILVIIAPELNLLGVGCTADTTGS
jgi:hypothetical protein